MHSKFTNSIVLTTAILIFAFGILAGCVSVSFKASAPTRAILLSDKQEIGIPFAEMEKELSRSNHLSSGHQDVRLTATLYTKAYLYERAKDSIERQAYRERWDSSQKALEFEKQLKKDLDRANSQTCFSIYVETRNPLALDSKYWHGDLIQLDAEPVRVHFEEFEGQTRTSLGIIPGPLVKAGYIKKDFHLLSLACAKKAVDTTRPLTLVIMPRYKEGIPPIRLEWFAEEIQGVEKYPGMVLKSKKTASSR
jgi:hypothetical protein